jgi:hypothetical protein
VAVGTGSLATPADHVTMTAVDGSGVVFRGDATATFGTVSLALQGNGKVVLTGDLVLVRPDKSQKKVPSVSFETGPFGVKVDPTATGLQVSATLQGAVTTG